MLAAIITIGLMAGSFGLILGYASVRFRVEGNPLFDLAYLDVLIGPVCL